MRSRQSAVGGFAANRGSVFTIMRLMCHSVFAAAAPMVNKTLAVRAEGLEYIEEAGDMIGYYVASAILVLAGGAFAGLTIALMGQDGVYLQVLAGDASEPQSKNAQRVYDLLKRGKHWVLVTLLLSNVIVNETLPVVLDRCLGGGVAAVIGSTVLIVIFGEVIPQSVCVRFGLQIGGAMAKPVLAMMWMMAPVAWPIAKLLDWMLGEDHPTVYKKSGLKQLVNLHQTLGDVSNRLNADEVTIISAVLDLKDKPVRDVMTPMDDVFVMPDDTVLDERTMDRILSAGYSRIPIHSAGNPKNFVGMLLVKILITYDPEDCKRVSDFALATLPETRPETSCLDIVNFFQEGKSHMVIVSACPGEDHGAMGVVTLEDVIEELIGEEIIDESDVYIDVHKAIRRLTPAPKARISRHESDGLDVRQPYGFTEGTITSGELSASPKPMTATFMMRAPSTDGRPGQAPVAVKANLEDMKSTLKRLGPSNPAANPKESKLSTVKIKHGLASPSIRPTVSSHVHDNDHLDDERTPLLGISSTVSTTEASRLKNMTGKGGVQAVRKSYGSQHHSESQARLAAIDPVIEAPEIEAPEIEAPEIVQNVEDNPVPPSAANLSLSPVAEVSVSESIVATEIVNVATSTAPAPAPATTESLKIEVEVEQPEVTTSESVDAVQSEPVNPPQLSGPFESFESVVPVQPTESPESTDPEPAAPDTPTTEVEPVEISNNISTPATDVTVYRTAAGSVITESVIETDGVRKIVIHTCSSGDEGDTVKAMPSVSGVQEEVHEEASEEVASTAAKMQGGGKKKKNKKKKKGHK